MPAPPKPATERAFLRPAFRDSGLTEREPRERGGMAGEGSAAHGVREGCMGTRYARVAWAARVAGSRHLLLDGAARGTKGMALAGPLSPRRQGRHLLLDARCRAVRKALLTLRR